MWDEARQSRFQDLRELEEQDSLSEVERAELTALLQERCRAEEAAVRDAARRAQETNVRLDAQVEQVQAQNRELERLIQEQEAYLAEVHALLAGMQERRRDWRERYTKLTGRALNDPVTAPPGG